MNLLNQKLKGWGHDGRVGGYRAHLPLLTHQKYIYVWSNSQLCVEFQNSSLKTNWKLALRLLHNQRCEKDAHETEQHEKGSKSVQLPSPSESGHRRGKSTQALGLPRESSV